jgi:hypothetical protein
VHAKGCMSFIPLRLETAPTGHCGNRRY